MSKTITIFLVCCLVFLSGPAMLARADSQSELSVYLPMLGNNISTAGPGIKGCLVTDTGGVNDKSFNAQAWQGLVEAKTAFGSEASYRESAQQTDYQKNIDAFIGEKCDLIVTVGFLLGDATKYAAEHNPGQKFAIVDFNYDPVIPNVRGLTFSVDEPAFLAGYMAAGTTRTGKVGVFGGLQIPPVTEYMDGFYYGAQYYNQQKGTAVDVLGWDPVEKKGLFLGNFDSTDDGYRMAQTLMDEGVDVILPVAGAAGLGTAQAVVDLGNTWVVGVDSDWTISSPQFANVILTSVMKRIDSATYHAMADVVNGQFTGGPYLGTLANGGAGLGTISSKVPAALKQEVEQVKAGIIAGTIPVHP